MCSQEYNARAKKKNKYHMGIVTRQGAEASLKNVIDKHFRKYYPVPPAPVAEPLAVTVSLSHNSIFLAGKGASC